MITYQSRQVWQRPWAGSLLVGAIAGGAIWWWVTRAPADEAVQPVAAVASQAGSWPGVRASAQVVESALVTPPPVMEDGRPADFSAEEWRALKSAVATAPNPPAEMERIIKYLRFQRGFEQWQALKGSPDVAHRQELAKRLLEQVPERLRQGEASMGEALMLAAALWEDLEPNEQLRKQRIEEAKAMLANAAPKPDPVEAAKDAARQAEYKRREAAIVADWQARPAAQRDQAKLEEALEAARQAVYAADAR